MILTPFFAGKRLYEPIALCLDAAVYCGLATWCMWIMREAPGADGDVVHGLALYLLLCIAPNAYRHITNARAACNQDTRPYGQVVHCPCLVEDATPSPASILYWAPLGLISIGNVWLLLFDPAARTGPLILLLLGSWGHFGPTRVHGDHRGGKHVPTLFVLILHLTSSLSGTPACVTVSLHRILIICSYFFTGYRKVYCTGFKWADGRNLQLMLGIQGLYHDIDHPKCFTFNFSMARSRALCLFASIGVLGTQLVMPIFLLLEWKAPSHGALLAAFWLAMFFHAGNHILWRINFFIGWCPALLALLGNCNQLSPIEIMRAEASFAPIVVVIVFAIMQLGHALDRLSEKILAAAHRMILRSDKDLNVIQTMCLSIIWMLELHLFGDYYTSYWPDTHEHRAVPVACMVAKFEDGTECLLPAPVCFYWRRDISKFLKKRGQMNWPASEDCKEFPFDLVLARLSRQLELTYLPQFMLSRIKRDSGKVFLRVRTLRHHDDKSLSVVRLWEKELDITRSE